MNSQIIDMKGITKMIYLINHFVKAHKVAKHITRTKQKKSNIANSVTVLNKMASQCNDNHLLQNMYIVNSDVETSTTEF